MAVYFIGGCSGGPIKIGFTGNGVESRISDLQTGHPWRLEALAVIDGDYAIERKLHWLLRESRLHGEWFERTADVEAVLSEARSGSLARWAAFIIEPTGAQKSKLRPAIETPSRPDGKRGRGRPKSGKPQLSPAEKQRAYRERKKAGRGVSAR